MNHCTLWLEGYWATCCARHDQDYADQIGRVAADADLFACVASSLPSAVVDNPLMASAVGAVSLVIAGGMWAAVRSFGWLFYRR